MSNSAWIASILVTALTFWALASVLKHRFLTTDESTINVLKLMLRHRDVDLSRIPDAALIDIIVATIDEAKALVRRRSMAGQAHDAWRRHLIMLLDGKADEIEQVLLNGPEAKAGRIVRGCLLTYGVISPPSEPPMSSEEFTDATKSGTLFATLDERLSTHEIF